MKTIADLLKEYSFFEGLIQEELTFIAGCGKNVVFKEGEAIAHPGDPANVFYLIREGQVALSMDAPPRKPFLFQTLGSNELVGLSWLIPPYLWTVSAQAISLTRVVALDGACLRKKCEEDTQMGFKLMKHLVQLLVKQEDAFRLHLLDVYGEHK